MESRDVVSTALRIQEIRSQNLEVLVADDNSPDGTWRIVQSLAQDDSGVHLLHRQTRKGRGYAGAEAFVKALELGAERVVEMDADFSHQPKHLPDLLAALDKGADVVVGSRLVTGGKDEGRGWLRVLLTRFSAFYARLILGLTIRDTNSGFRAYAREALEAIEPETLVSAGPSIVHEVFARAGKKGLKIVEVPITFIEREHGESELTIGRLLNGFIMVWRVRKMTSGSSAKASKTHAAP